MRVAINLVKDGTAQACVSAGNTGALMAIARFVLKTLPGIDRPAIASQLPTKQGETTVLDLGANVNCTPEQLVQFAVMGSALVTAVDGIERPTIGLLNIGEEDIKGNDVVKRTAELLKLSGLNFVGNVEGNDIFKGTTRRRGLRRLRRQRHAEGLRRPRHDALRLPEGGVHAQSADQARRGHRVSGAVGVQAAHRSAPPQRRDAGRPEGHRGEEPRRRRRARVPLRAAKGARRSRRTACSTGSPSGSRRCRRSRRRRNPHADTARRGRRPMPSRIAGTGRYLPAQRPHQRGTRAARRHQRRVDPHAHRHPRSATSRRRDERRPISRCTRRARRSRRRASRRPTSTSSSSRRRRPT